jgi:hypothetical protein
MSQRRAVVTPVATPGLLAIAIRKVIVQKLTNGDFVNSVQLKALTLRPSGEMSDAGQVTVGCSPRVPAFGQELLEIINKWTDKTVGEPVDVGVARTFKGTHGGLQKWDRQWTRTRKLCPDLR